MKCLKTLLLACCISLSGIFFSSCYTEQSLGAKFIRKTNQDQPTVWFIGASHIYRTCGKYDDTTEYPCHLLNAVDDSAALEDYNRSFAMQLAEYGYRVFTYDEAETFFAQKGLGLIINIAQLELEEVFDTYTDSEVFDSLEYFETFPITMLKLNSWIEVTLVDTTQSKREVFYGSNSASDLIEGYFTQNPFRGDVNYTYKRYDMKPSILIRFIPGGGKEHAQKLFDVWMNRYIQKNSTETGKAGSSYSVQPYYHYNPSKGRIESADPSTVLKKL